MKKKEEFLFIIFCITFLIINLLFLNNVFKGEIIFNFNKDIFKMILIVSIILEIILCFGIYFFNKKNIKIENIFLFTVIPLGLFFLILIPVGQSPDDNTHLQRIYEISKGYLVSDENGRNLPEDIDKVLILNKSSKNYDNILNNLQKKNSDKERKYVFANTALYSFVCYIPQTIGVLIGKLFNAPILLTAYLGRLCNFILFILLIYLSIKYIPFCKEFVLLISLLPITLQEAVSISPDCITISSVIFLVSYTLYLTYTKDKIVKKDLIIESILCIVISLCKIVYLPVCLILFIIPKEKFKSLKDKNIKIIGLAFFVVLINLLWLKIASGLLIGTKEGVIPDKQTQFILNSPLSYIKAILNTLRYNSINYIYSMLGEWLQAFNVNVTRIYPTLALIFMIILTIIQRFKDIVVKKKEKLIFFVIISSVVLLIFTSLYIQWTPYQRNVIDGIQGRYFLPILVLVPLLFLKTKENKYKLKFDKLDMYVLAYSVFSNICALIYIFSVNS